MGTPNPNPTENLVMLVDDDPDIRESVGEVLQLEGYAVTTSEDGKKALESLESGPLPRLILLDLMMPHMNGFEFLREKEKNSHFREIPVVAFSAAQQQRPLPEGVHWLAKPVDLNILLETVSNALHAPS